jgi:hypothetical protein
MLALVEELAGIDRHNLRLCVAALRAGQHRREPGDTRPHLATVDEWPASVVSFTNAAGSSCRAASGPLSLNVRILRKPLRGRTV